MTSSQKPPRNPRRAYDKDGAEIEPSRIGKMRANGEVTVSVHCVDCNRHVILSTEGMPDDLAVPDIPVAYPLTCSACGSKHYTVMHDMTAFYDRILAMKGRQSELPADREVLRLPARGPT